MVGEAVTAVIGQAQARGVREPWTHAGFIDAIVARQRDAQQGADRTGSPSPPGFVRPTAARRISYEASLAFEEVHERVYVRLGYELVDIASGSVQDRADAIERELR